MTELPRPPDGTPELYEQDGLGMDAVVHAHYFLGGSDWLVTEYDREGDVAFGWACLGGDRQMAELGYTSLAELEAVRVPLRVAMPSGEAVSIGEQRVEYEYAWQPKPLREAIDLIDKRQGRTITQEGR